MEKNIDTNKLEIILNKGLYPLEVIYAASYKFIDKSFVYLDEKDETSIRVELTGKKIMEKDQLEALAGEFKNELINSALRVKIAERNHNIREFIVSSVLANANDDASENAFEDDPLGIAQINEDYAKSVNDGK